MTERIDRTGEERVNKFGSLIKIKKYRNNKDIDVYFIEYDWTIKHISYDNFLKGRVKCPYERRIYSHGYIGEGPYNSKANGKTTRSYIVWHDMLNRCYNSSYQEKNPTYIDCTVCDEWLNYQNFAKWYEENYYEIENKRMHLDKDILVKGNKIYSPKTCIFAPIDINILFIKNDTIRGDFPIGVYYNKLRKKYVSQCKIGANNIKFLGHYDTPEEAFQAYKQFKENYVKQIANQYKGCIPEKLYYAMYEYEVEIDD